MSPPTSEVKDTSPPPVKIRIPWEKWRDLKHAAKASAAKRGLSGHQADRAAVLRRFIAWYLNRPGAELPERPYIKDWSAAARADIEKPKDLPRQVRAGNDWHDFESAAGAASTDRSAVINAFIDWYLRRKGASLPERPDLEAWAGAGPVKDDDHDMVYAAKAIGMEPEAVIRAFTSWFLHRTGAPAPTRPPLEAWRDDAEAAIAAQRAAAPTSRKA